MTRNESQNKVFGDLYGPARPMTEGERAIRKALTDAANAKTADMRAARDDALKAYSRISEAFNLCWREAWNQARAEMILGAEKAP